ncbi:MAG: SEC-C metal-binding domain-containing protein [Acidobacteriota bacterium]
MLDFAARLHSELLPATQLEELFFDTIARLSTCASFLARHIEDDPDFTNAETPRRMRLLLSTESKLRYAYEEFRRLKMARQLQIEDSAQAARPLLAVVATHTSRSGFRKPPKSPAAPNPIVRQIQKLELNDAAEDATMAATQAQRIETVLRPPTPGRNAQCTCNSGRKYKHCCANKQAAA